MKRAVVLLSGGIDSATTLAIAKQQGYEVLALSFEYGQRHAIEMASAKRLAAELGATEHRVAKIDLRLFGGSALTDTIEVPKKRLRHPEPRRRRGTSRASSRTPERSLAFARDDASVIPVTYVPARNTIFLSYALAWAEVLGARHIFIGANAVDYSGYPDCRPEFIAQFEKVANVATKAGISGERFHVQAPLIQMSKAQIIRKGAELGVDFALTHSCYDPAPDGLACGECDSCILRCRGFAEAGIRDPTRYQRLSS